MGLVDLQENGNGLGKLPCVGKGKYRRMDGAELAGGSGGGEEEEEEEEALSSRRIEDKKDGSRRYVFACAVFASLNSVLLGYDNRAEEARSVLLKINENEAEVDQRLAEIEEAVGLKNVEKYEDKVVWWEFLRPSSALRQMVITGFGIQCFQQITGIDATVYYSPTIFKDAGIKSNKAILAATVAVGFTKTIFILVAILLIDKVGRKPLLYVSTIGMTTCLFGLGLALSFLGHGLGSREVGIGLAVLAVCGNVAFFSVGIGPVCWVLTSEIFPLRLRAQAAALGAVGNRVSSGLIAMSFLSVFRAISVAGTFFIFSVISTLSVAFVNMFVPETKGKSLEEIELMFQNGRESQISEVELGDVECLVQK